jgi:hypothetical protein
MLLPHKRATDYPGFIFVGEYPAIDFANTLSMSQGQWVDHLRVCSISTTLRRTIDVSGAARRLAAIDTK